MIMLLILKSADFTKAQNSGYLEKTLFFLQIKINQLNIKGWFIATNSFVAEVKFKAVDTCPFVFDSVPDQYKTQEMCDKAFTNDPFMIYCLYRYKTQEMCDEAVDDFLSALKSFPDWFVQSKMIKKLNDALLPNDTLFLDEDSGNATFCSDKMGIISVDLNTANLDMLILMKMILKLLFMSDLWLGPID